MLQNDSQAGLANGSTDARNDVDSLSAGNPGPAAGNVISGAGTLTGANGADSGPNVTVVAIQGEGGAAELTPAAAGPMQVQGRYGTLTIDGDGNYSYVRNAGSPDGVQDVFNYTVAGANGARDTATLTILLEREGETVQPQQIVATNDGVVVLPAGVELSDIRVVGRDLVITLPDGSTMTIPNGAVFVPQLVIGDVEVPPSNLAALLIDAEPKPAAGTPEQLSSGGNFADPVPPLDPGVPLGDLLPPTEMNFPLPVFEEVGQFLDREPEAGPNPPVQLDDDAKAGGIAGGTGDVSPDTANLSGVLSGSGGDGQLTFDLTTVVLPEGLGFTAVDGPDGSILIKQGGVTVITVTIDADTGEYTVTQNAAIDHPGGGDENDLAFVINYTVTDQDGDTASSSLTINVDDDTPVVSNVQTGPGVTLDETNATAGHAPGSFPLTATSASAAISATLAFGADGAASANSTVYSLSLQGGGSTLASGISTAVGDHPITLNLTSSTLITATYTDGSGTHTAFTIQLNGNGTVTVTQYVPLEHTTDGSTAAAYDDALSLSGLVNATVTITDGDGDAASGNAPIGAGIIFRDDGPSIDVSIADRSEPNLLTQDADTIGAATDTDVSTANFGNMFAVSFNGGADGAAGTPPLTYALDVTGYTGTGIDSGLDQSGGNIYLYEIGGKVVGSTSATLAGVTAGNTVFDVSVDSSGVVTLTQYSQIDHPIGSDPSATGAPFADQILSLADAAVTLTATGTVTDNDGDTATDSVSVNIGANLRFADDGPDISATLTGTQIRIDETDGVVAAGGEVDPAGGNLGTVTMTAASLYTVSNVHASADSPTTLSYALTLSGQGVASGLLLSTTNATIYLYNVGGVVYGSTSATEGGVNAGNTAFTVSINSSGDVTLTQFLAVEHTNTSSFDEDSSSLTSGVLNVSITATDYDGDTDQASVDLGSKIVFEDDGPSISVSASADAGVLLTTQDPDTIGAATDSDASSANFNSVFSVSGNGGSDGAAASASLSYVLDVTGYVGGPGGIDSGLDQTGANIYLYEIGGKVVGSTSATLAGVTAGNTVFDVSVNGSGVVTLTQYSQIDHPIGSDPSATGAPFADHIIAMADSLVTLTANGSITDNDGDTATDSETIDIGANLRFGDDGPDISVSATATQIRIDETDGVVAAGGEVDPAGGNLGTVTMSAASLYTVSNVHSSADAPTTLSYGLTLSSQGVASGLLLSTTNATIYLYKIAGVVYGSTSTTEAGVNAGNTAFTASINGSGDVTLTQFLAVEHTNTSSFDEDSASLTNGVLNVTVTATDYDGDTDSASVDIGNRIVFEDDGPSVNVNAGADGSILLQTQDGDTIGVNTDTSSSSANFGGVFSLGTSSGGSDGAASTPALSYQLDVTGYAGGPGGIDSGLDQGANNIYLYEIGGKVVGSTSATLAGVTAGNTVFDVSVSGSGIVTLTQYSQINHPIGSDPTPSAAPFSDQFVSLTDGLVTLTGSATITDNDGDTATDSEVVNIGANLRFYDDGPVAVADTNTVTEGGQTTGNVLTDGTDDNFGADGQGSIQGVQAGTSTATPVSGGIGVPINTSLGTLTLLANGNYTYVSNDNSVTTTQVDHFVYTIVDADGDTSTVTLDITINPVNLTPDNDTIIVNEAALDTTITGNDVAAGSVTGSNPSSTAETTGGTLVVAGAVSYTLTDPAVGSYGTISLNSATGAYTYTLTSPYDTSPDANNGTNTELARDVFHYTATDANGNTVNGTITVNIIDDVPSVDVVAGSDATVFLETQDGDTIAGATDTDASSANFDSVFSRTFVAGADGAAAPTITYALDVTGYTGGPAGIDSGLDQGANNIYLYEIGGKVVGSTSATLAGVTAGNTVFDVSTTAGGVVTLTQYSQINHPVEGTTTAPFSDQFVSLADGLVTLTGSSTITDNDGDTATDSATINIGANLRFYDDGPDVSLALAGPQLRIDETDNVVAAGGETDGPGGNLGTVTLSAATLFTLTDPHASADATTTYVYSLLLGPATGGLVDSGLDLSSTDANIYLWNIGGVVYGSTSTTLAGVNAGNTAFTVSITSGGSVTLTQFLGIEHPNPATPDEDSASLIANALQVQVLATDYDGDTDTATVDLGSKIVFEDDAPRFGPDIDATVQIDNDATPSSLGNDLDIVIGSDSPVSGNDVISLSNFTVKVNGVALAPADYTLTPGTETATTANYTFSFTYDVSATETDTINGTLVFHKDSGTYDVTLDGPVQGFSTLETKDGTAFQGYVLNTDPGVTDVEAPSNPKVAVTTIIDESAPGQEDGFYVQFTGIAAGNSGHETVNYGPVDPATGDGANATWTEGELFSEGTGADALWNSYVTVSNASNGVAGDTVNGPDVINFDLYSSNPGGTVGGLPTTSASDMFLVFDGIGSAEDMIVVLKLWQDSNGNGEIDAGDDFTTKAVLVQNGDIYKFDAAHEASTVAALSGTDYEGVVSDIVALGGSNNNDGLVIIESNDYNIGGSEWRIVGAEIVNAEGTVDGTAINLNGAVDKGLVSGDSDVDNNNALDTQNFGDDPGDVQLNTNPLKITNIGFIAGSANDQNAEIDFDVNITDADGDTATQHISIDVGDTSVNTPFAPASTMVVSQEADTSSYSLLASDSGTGSKLFGDGLNTDTDHQLKLMNAANNNAVFLGAIAAAGLVGTPAAAQVPSFDTSALAVGNFETVTSSLTANLGQLDAFDGQSMVSSKLGAMIGSGPMTTFVESAGHGSDVASILGTLTGASGPVSAPIPAQLSQGVDLPAVQQVTAQSLDVGMVSAEALAGVFGHQLGSQQISGQLTAQALTGQIDAQQAVHTQELGRVLADALAGGGSGPNLDAIIDAAAGKPQAGSGLEVMAIHPGADVSAWDTGIYGAFHAGPAFAMDALQVHPDAAVVHAA